LDYQATRWQQQPVINIRNSSQMATAAAAACHWPKNRWLKTMCKCALHCAMHRLFISCYHIRTLSFLTNPAGQTALP